MSPLLHLLTSLQGIGRCTWLGIAGPFLVLSGTSDISESVTSNGYNLAIGLLIIPIDVPKLAEQINQSAPLFTPSITASFHCTLGMSSWIRTMSPTFAVYVLFPVVQWNSRNAVRCSVFCLFWKWANNYCAWTLALLLMSSVFPYVGSVSSSSWTS